MDYSDSTQARYSHWPMTKANGRSMPPPARPMLQGLRAVRYRRLRRYHLCPRVAGNIKHGFDFYMQDADLDEGADRRQGGARLLLGDPPLQRSGKQLWLDEFMGWARFLIEEHFPMTS